MINNDLKKDVKWFNKGNKKYCNPPWLIFIFSLTEKLLIFSKKFPVIKNTLENDCDWKKYLVEAFLPYQKRIKSIVTWDTKEMIAQKKVSISPESMIENDEFEKIVLPKIESECKNLIFPLSCRKFLEMHHIPRYFLLLIRKFKNN